MTEFRVGGFQQLPTIVKNIIIINVIVVLAQFALGKYGINLGDYLGLHYWQSPRFHWWQLITHMFVHGDPYDVQETIMHIFFNMFALWMFGRILENMWGPKRFLIFYLVCGVGAALCHLSVLTFQFHGFYNDFMAYQLHPSITQFAQFVKHHNNISDILQVSTLQSFWASHPDCSDCGDVSKKLIFDVYNGMINENTVGASGAVFGVLFAFGYLFPNTLLYVYFAIPVKAKWVVAVYALIELFAGVRNSSTDNIAHFAHLGGMLFAFILLRIWKRTNRNRFY